MKLFRVQHSDMIIYLLLAVFMIVYGCNNNGITKSNQHVFSWNKEPGRESGSVFVEFIFDGKNYGVGYNALYDISNIKINLNDEIRIILPEFQGEEFYNPDYCLPFFESGLVHRWIESGATIVYILENRVIQSYALTWRNFDGIMGTNDATEAAEYTLDGQFIGNGKEGLDSSCQKKVTHCE